MTLGFDCSIFDFCCQRNQRKHTQAKKTKKNQPTKQQSNICALSNKRISLSMLVSIHGSLQGRRFTGI